MYSVMKMYVEVQVTFHAFLTSVLDWGERPASRLGRFTHSGKTTPFPISVSIGYAVECPGVIIAEEKSLLLVPVV